MGIVNGENGTGCECHSNLYEGKHCGKKVLHCTPTKCLNGGICEEAQGTFFCACPKSFEGVQCEIAVTEERERAEGHFLWYESDIYEANNQTFIILLKIMGSNLRYEFSSGDGFKFTAIANTFSHSSSAKEFALKNNVNSEDIPAGLIGVMEIVKLQVVKYEKGTVPCWFRVIKRVPNAVLVGGNQRIVDWAKQFVVDGSTSVDIDTELARRSRLVWRYNWTCWNSKHPEETESFCKGKSTTLPYEESKITVPAKALLVNETYIFGLIAAVDNRVSELVVQEIVVVEKKPMELELRCKKNCDKVLLPVMSIIYEVVCSSCKGTIFYGWDMIPGSDNKKLNIDWEKETERGRNSSVLVIPANTLLPGDVYTFKVNAVSSYLNQEGSAAVNLQLHSDLVVGKCSVEPTEGVSLITYFTVQCMGFQDNTEASHAALLYQFHQKSLKDGAGELMTLLDYDTEPIADNMMLVPGDPENEYNSVIAVKVSNHIGMNVWYNLSVKVEPLSTDVEDLDDIEGLMSLLTSKSGDSIHGMLSSGNIPGAMQYITSLTEVISGIKDANAEQRTADIRNNLRENLIEMLNEATLDSPSVVKQVSTVLFKVASLWENEKPEKSQVLGQETFKVSSEMAKSSGSLILKISNALSNEAWSKEDFFSSGDFRHIARHLMSVGENVILNNRTDKLYRVDDDWEEANDDINQSKKLMKEKNEDYPNYKEFDIYYQSNLENFRLASYWFFEGLKRIGNSISADLFLEENAVKLQNKNSFLCLKKFKASDLNGQKFGSPGDYSGLKVSREYAEGIQSGVEDVFSLEVTIFTSNPIWWIQTSPNSPEVNTEVVFANFRNLKNEEMVDAPGILKGIEVFLALNSYEKKVVEGAGNSPETQVGVNEDDDVTVHQIQAPDGASIVISFEPPPVQGDKFMVVILKNHRPTREDFTGDAVLELPHTNSNLDKKDSLSIFVRGSFNKEEPGFPQFFYLSALPHPNQSHSNTDFSYKFSVNNLLCTHYAEGVGKWLSDGCEVGHESTFDGVHCTCSHLSLFGAAFSVAPNKIDPFSDVKLFLKVVENPVSVALVCTILLLYIILMVFARRKDLKDKRKIHVLNTKGRKVMQSGGEDWFIMLCPCSLGELLNIRMWHDNSGKKPAWYCKRVIVRELKEMQVKGAWIFPVERWLAVYGTPMAGTFTGIMPCCKVGVATPVELRNWKDIFTDTALLGFSDKHLWLSIFYR
ncbi:polycystin family receptor for egg jelly-like [Hetaerina americana]|uniref:polycystin family receptor for egg jelly-like n=1 Tax=Hetaerina americana TaxID=62018 RepID=UPI003A7F32C0